MEQSEWMKDQRSSKFASGMTEFITLAERIKKRVHNDYYILCPCNDCGNIVSHKVTDIEYHLFKWGFMDGYTR